MSRYSSKSSNTQYTSATANSTAKPIISGPHQHSQHTQNSADDEDETGIDPRASSETYASTVASDDDIEPVKPQSIYPQTRQTCFQPDAFATTPAEFAELFPSTRRILIQHDDTTPDGNLNLRLDTELCVCKGHKVKLTLFHLRMYDLAERQFSLRRYQRQSGREVCSSRRKYWKPTVSSLPTRVRRGSIISAWAKLSPKALKLGSRLASRQVLVDEEDDSGDDIGNFTAQGDVPATIPTDSVKLEFSNYAQVEIQCGRNADGKYVFEYWGTRYIWRRSVYRDEADLVFSFELVNMGTGACIAHITPDKLSPKQSKQEAKQGTWIPPSSMRLTDKCISNDLGDVIVATGIIVLVDDCIHRHLDEPHRL